MNLQDFLKGVKEGFITVHHDYDLYRHIEISYTTPEHPNTRQRFSVMTWPNCLMVSTEGAYFLFAGTLDMMRHFRQEQLACDINPSHWLSKLISPTADGFLWSCNAVAWAIRLYDRLYESGPLRSSQSMQTEQSMTLTGQHIEQLSELIDENNPAASLVIAKVSGELSGRRGKKFRYDGLVAYDTEYPEHGITLLDDAGG